MGVIIFRLQGIGRWIFFSCQDNDSLLIEYLLGFGTVGHMEIKNKFLSCAGKLLIKQAAAVETPGYNNLIP